MFRIICLASFVGAVVAFVMIALFYFKNKSVVVPYIVFFAFIIVVGISAFFISKVWTQQQRSRLHRQLFQCPQTLPR